MTATIGYLTKRFPRLSETFILDEILGLEAAGVPLRLYAIADPGETLVQADVARVASPVVYLRSPAGREQSARRTMATFAAHARLLGRSPRRYLGVVGYIVRKRRHRSTLRHFADAGRLAVLLEAEGACHLHAAFAHDPASVAHFVHLLTGIPFSFGAHAKDIYASEPELLARKVAAASFVLTCSESAAVALRAIAGTAAARVVLARHGVDTARFAPASGEARDRPPRQPLRVLAVGRLVDKKGYPVLLEALAALDAAGRSVSCTVVGAGPAKAALEAIAARLGIASAVRFVGARTHQEVAAMYRRADVFVQASVILANGDRDGIPNSLLEAMASGLAVVASDVAGIPEVVLPGCGLLVPPGDGDALAGALRQLADDPDLRARLGSAARRHVIAHLDRSVCARAIAPLFGVGLAATGGASASIRPRDGAALAVETGP